MKLKKYLSFLLLIWFSQSLQAQRPDLHFAHISTDKGLSHNHVKSIIKDFKGFMWFGSTFGLNRFDGLSMEVYLNIPDDSTSLNDNDVAKIFEDSKKNLWVATRTGLNRYDRDKNRFIRFHDFGSSIVNNLYEDSNRNLWATAGDLLFKLNPETQSFELFLNASREILAIFEDSRGTLWLSSDSLYKIDIRNKRLVRDPILNYSGINALFEDKERNLWMLSYGQGVFCYNLNTGKTTVFKADPHEEGALKTNTVTCINEDQYGNIWIGSLHGGLMIYDIKKKGFHNFENIPGDAESLGFNSLKCIYRDTNGHMWIGTYSSGVDFITEKSFHHIYNNPAVNNGLNNNSIIALEEDKKGNLLIGTDGGGLNIYNKETGRFNYLIHDAAKKNTIGSNIVSALLVDANEQLWVGCWDGGLSLLDKNGIFIKKFVHNPLKPDESLLNNSILSIYEDNEFNIWVGTLTGLNRIDHRSHQITRYDVPERDLKNYINAMMEDEDGNFWIGTWAGLTILNKDSKKYSRFLPDENNIKAISSDKIFDLFMDSKSRMWVATAGGLNLYNKSDQSFKAFRAQDGLPSDAVYGILESEDGDLWLSTANGLSRFNPEQLTFKNFNVKDGLQGNQFKEHAFVKLQSGELIFGGVNGLNIFEPENIKKNTFIPPVVITDFKIFNATVPVKDAESPLTKHVSETDEIIISYKESVISFEFAALNYLVSEKNQYAYKLEGFEDDWNYVKTQRNATYTNLDPGKYTLRVKGSNNDQEWNEAGTSLSIVVTPPYWKTWWFIVFVTLSASFILFIFVRHRFQRVRKYQQELENQVKERTIEISLKNNALEDHAGNLRKANLDVIEKEQKLKGLYTEMKDSIRAAEVIQKSILPNEAFVKEGFPESFILYLPKDVVSGDFYWYDCINGKKVIAAVDCTGHGVSGAFMSINGHHLLNQAIYGHDDLQPSEILDRLNLSLTKRLRKSYEDNEFMDGMDISLCILNDDNSKMKFSGAGLPLYLARDNELIQIKGTRLSIGYTIKDKTSHYFNHEVSLKKGDIIYLFSDGFPDQMGGDSGEEKFSYPRFRELLVSNSHRNMADQSELLQSTLQNWRKDVDQLDDIIIIGLKIT